MKVNQADLNRILAAIDRVGLVVASLAKSITEESAKEFADLLRNNITTQKYGDFGRPHGAWKKGFENESMYWLWLGTLFKSIAPWKVQESTQLVQWFTGLKYGGGVSQGISTKTKAKTKKDTLKTGAVIMKGGKRIEVRAKLTPAQQQMKQLLQKRAMEARAARSNVKHISPVGYVLQRKSGTGVQIGGGSIVSFGKAGKRIIKRQTN